jgi:IS4 transposase
VILILDETHEPFYGNINNNPTWVHEYKPEKGCTGSFKFLCASIIFNDKRYFLESIPLNIFYDMKKEIERILTTIESYGIRIEVVLMDRGFSKSSQVIDLLNKRKLKYLMLYPEYKNVEKLVKEVECYKRIPFEVRGVKTTLVVVKDEKYAWKFVTNLNFKESVKYIKVYKNRWNIETGFRLADETRVKTKSLDIRISYFFFLLALILYNIWYFLGKPTSFKKFVLSFNSTVNRFFLLEAIP